MMKKLFFLTLLILLVGTIGFIPEERVRAQTWYPHLEISEFTCPTTSFKGDTVNVSATCKNPTGQTFSLSARDVYLYIGVPAGSPVAGEICSRKTSILGTGDTIDCSGSFTMPNVDTDVYVECDYHDSGYISRSTTSEKWVTLTGGPPGPPPGPPGPPGPPPPCPPGAICIQNPLTATSFEAIVGNLIDFIFYFALALAPLMVIIGAIYLLTSAGNPKRIDTGKNIIIYTLIALAIILFAKGLIAVLEKILGIR